MFAKTKSVQYHIKKAQKLHAKILMCKYTKDKFQLLHQQRSYLINALQLIAKGGDR